MLSSRAVEVPKLAPKGERPPRLGWIALAVILLLSCALYLPVFGTAFFTLDDYRYLRELRDIDAGVAGAWARAFVVENRWDQFWWVEEGSYVRFFRPLLIFSYQFDRWLWGESPAGFVASNLLLHLVAILLAASCYRKLFGGGVGLLVATLCFATQYVHHEHVFYIAGRTGLIAGILFLAALRLHLTVRERPSLVGQMAVAALCFVAFLCKEFTVLLPPLLLLLDRWQQPDGQPTTFRSALLGNRRLYLGIVVAGFAYLLLREIGLGEAGSGSRPYPYFYMPDRDGFVPRTAAVWLQYCSGLSLGAWIEPYLNSFTQLTERFELDTAPLRVHPVELVLGTLWIMGLSLWALCGRAGQVGRWFAVLMLVTWIPLLPISTSARPLFLPSIGYCALLGLVVDALARRDARIPRAFALAIVAMFLVLPASRLWRINDWLPPLLADPAPRGVVYSEMIEASGARIEVGRSLFVFDLPGGWYEAQFLPDAMAVVLDRPMPQVSTIMLGSFHEPLRSLQIERVDDHVLRLRRGGVPLHDPDPDFNFDTPALEPGDVVERAGYRLEVVASEAGRPTEALLRFERGLDQIELVQFRHEAGKGWHATALRW